LPARKDQLGKKQRYERERKKKEKKIGAKVEASFQRVSVVFFVGFLFIEN